MPRHQGYYSLVQFCPDPARAEVANVGVLLFVPSENFLETKVSTLIKRVRTVFPHLDYDVHQLREMFAWLDGRLSVERDRIRAKDDLCHFINTRFNDIRLTSPKPVMVDQPNEVLASLYEKLVALPQGSEDAVEMEVAWELQPFQEVDSFFRRPGIIDHVAFMQTYEVPVSGRRLDVPYVFTNGVISLVKPERIASFDAAEKRLVDGLLMTRHPGPGNKRQEFFVLAEIEKQRLRDQVGQLCAEVCQGNVKFFVEPKPLLHLLEARAGAH